MESQLKGQEYLQYHFTEDEKRKLSEELARAIGVKEDAELRLKQVTTQIKSEIQNQETTINGTANKIRQGYEYRNIACTITKDFDRKRFIVTRDDTGEIVTDRKLTKDELQLEMATK